MYSLLHLPTFSLFSRHPHPQRTPNNPLFLSLLHPSSTSIPPLSLIRFQNLRLLPAAAAASSTPAAAESVEELPEGLRRELMPRHVAVIMDGNARWARQRGLPRSAGHAAGIRSLKRMVEMCCKWGINVLTVFGFSSDNWVRPKDEVDFIMSLLEKGLQSEMDTFMSQGIRISVIGDISRLPSSIQKWVSLTEEKTKNHTKLHLIVAVSYSGKYDITNACRSVAQKVKDGLIQVEDVNEGLIETELETKCTEFPNPDLLIRTSGELRISNFLLWQLAYTELFFSKPLWPDFDQEHFLETLMSFQHRSRRFGGRDLEDST